MTEPDKQPFTAHLEELRSRLIKSFIAVAVGFLISYGFKEQIFKILTAPLMRVLRPGDHLIYTNLPEAFFTLMKAAFISGIMLASPILLYQFWMFVAPGLYDREKRLVFPILLLSTLFFAGGALFGYFVVFPLGFEFFLSFASDTIRPMPSMKEYLGFSSKMLLAFGLVFEMPLVITFMARLGIVSMEFLKRFRKYAILVFFIVAAILTPPDVVSQILMALPMMLLYEISIIGARLFGRQKNDVETEKEAET
ncbi:MAG: twin-arginine translocase subunit TatC [Desulfobacteraceae bacterium]|nr:MAG: twin-arginine translocase subunit TatC [Desulfobacteraceae bacterium]